MEMSKHYNGWDFKRAAEKNGIEIHIEGDHCKGKAPAGRGYMVWPLKNELPPFVECKVKKWFKAAGILLSLICGLAYIVFMA